MLYLVIAKYNYFNYLPFFLSNERKKSTDLLVAFVITTRSRLAVAGSIVGELRVSVGGVKLLVVDYHILSDIDHIRRFTFRLLLQT